MGRRVEEIMAVAGLCAAIRRAKHPIVRYSIVDANGVFDHPWSSHTFRGRPVRGLLVTHWDAKSF